MKRNAAGTIKGTEDGAGGHGHTVADDYPQATFCIDPFHVVTWCEEAPDTVRRQQWNEARRKADEENKGKGKRQKGRPKGGSVAKTAAQKEAEIMKNAKYPLLMNPEHLSEPAQVKLRVIFLYNRWLATACRLKEGLRAILHPPAEEVRLALEKWMAYSFRDIDDLIALIYLLCARRVICLPGRSPGAQPASSMEASPVINI